MEAVPNFPDGFFFIRCKSQPFALDVNNGSMLVNIITIIITYPRTHLVYYPI